MSVGVLVPVKAFAEAKVRLAPALGASERAQLARSMGEQILAAAAPLPVSVACDDDQVASWAEAHGAAVVWTPGLGLNGAVMAGVAALAQAGFRRVIVAHADLPRARTLAPVADFDGVTLVPDRRSDGTNVACVPVDPTFPFSYGPGSFKRHSATTLDLGLPLRVLRDDDLGWDVDLPIDLPAVPA